MQKIVLVGINSQFIHTNLSIRYLKKYVEKYSDLKIEIYESNINNKIQNIISDLFNLKAEHYIFSTYIWNKEYVFKIVNELKKIMPNITISLGGPEPSYSAEKTLLANKTIDYVLVGEGEKVILNFLTKEKEKQKGVAFLNKDKKFSYLGDEMPIEDLDTIPFPYDVKELEENIKILYYESSRGCPFSCSYCLSSIEKCVRYLSLDRVKSDLKYFINSNVKLIKFIDRTFNLKKDRYLAIWEFLLENYKEDTVFHFEINANVFDSDVIEFLKKVPEGYFQFEIGIQSINIQTMESIKRKNNLEYLKNIVLNISKNIHLHVDLIAGLPYDTYETFKNSFNYTHSLNAEMIQLGFLKILNGTQISKEIEEYDYRYNDFPPYEILSNKFISFEEIIKLKNIETMLDYYYNSGQFKNSIKYIIEKNYKNAFDFYEAVSNFYVQKELIQLNHKTISIFNYLVEFYIENKFENLSIFLEYLKLDYLLLGKTGVYPEWFISNRDKEKHNAIILAENFKTVRDGHKYTNFENFSYNVLEHKIGNIEILFNYSNKKVKMTVFNEN